MFTGEEQPIRKYQGDLVDRKGKVKLGVSQHTVPSVPVSGDVRANRNKSGEGRGKTNEQTREQRDRNRRETKGKGSSAED